MPKKYKDDSEEVRAYAESQLKKQGRVDPAKRKDFEAQDQRHEAKESGLTAMFRAGVNAIQGKDSDLARAARGGKKRKY